MEILGCFSFPLEKKFNEGQFKSMQRLIKGNSVQVHEIQIQNESVTYNWIW
jgi:hypothetical protein